VRTCWGQAPAEANVRTNNQVGRKRKKERERETMADLFAWFIISFFLLISLLVLVTYQIHSFISLFKLIYSLNQML